MAFAKPGAAEPPSQGKEQTHDLMSLRRAGARPDGLLVRASKLWPELAAVLFGFAIGVAVSLARSPHATAPVQVAKQAVPAPKAAPAPPVPAPIAPAPAVPAPVAPAPAAPAPAAPAPAAPAPAAPPPVEEARPRAPEILTAAPTASSLKVRAGEKLEFSASAIGDEIQYWWMVDNKHASREPQFTYVPGADEVGRRQVSLEVEGPGGVVKRRWSVAVQPVPAPDIREVQPAPGTLDVELGKEVRLVVRPGEQLRYSWTIDGRDAGNGRELKFRPTETGTQTVRLVASNDRGGSTDRTWQVAVREPATVARVEVPPPPPASAAPAPREKRAAGAAAKAAAEAPPTRKAAEQQREQAAATAREAERRERAAASAREAERRERTAAPARGAERHAMARIEEQHAPRPAAALQEKQPEPVPTIPVWPENRVANLPPPVPDAKRRHPSVVAEGGPVVLAPAAPGRWADQPAPVPTTPPRSSPKADASEVRDLLERYRTAWQAQDVETLRRLGNVTSDAQARALDDYFTTVEDLSVDVQILGISENEKGTTVRFRRKDSFRDPLGREVSKESPVIEKQVIHTPQGARFERAER
jgi:hypothetical protein